jgi:MFS family permease
MVINTSYLVSAFLMPLAGSLIDKKGYLIYVIYISGILNLIGHILNLLLPDCGPDDGNCFQAIIPYILFGLNYTLNVIVAYGAIPYVIDDASKLGTAYGVFTCIANLG